MAEAVVEDNLDPVPNFVPSPEVRASVQIQLIGHTQVIGAEQGQEDLRLYFLALRPENITTLQQLLPELTRPAQITDKADSKVGFLHFQAIIAKKLEVGEGLS